MAFKIRKERTSQSQYNELEIKDKYKFRETL